MFLSLVSLPSVTHLYMHIRACGSRANQALVFCVHSSKDISILTLCHSWVFHVFRHSVRQIHRPGDWNQINPERNSAVEWTVWSSGRPHSIHGLRAQDLHRRQQWAHADQLPCKKRQLQPWKRLEIRNFWGFGPSSSTGSLTSNETPVREYDSVASSFLSTRKLAQGNESVASVKGSVLREKSDRELNSVRALSDRQHFHDYLERKAEFTVRGEVTCVVAWVGLRRMHRYVSSAVCTRCAWLECLSFFVLCNWLSLVAVSARACESLRLLTFCGCVPFSQHSHETGDCEVGTSACGRDCGQVCCDTCFSAETEIAQKDTFGALRRQCWLIENWNIKDWYYIRRINGLSRLKEKINLCGEFGNEE